MVSSSDGLLFLVLPSVSVILSQNCSHLHVKKCLEYALIRSTVHRRATINKNTLVLTNHGLHTFVISITFVSANMQSSMVASLDRLTAGQFCASNTHNPGSTVNSQGPWVISASDIVICISCICFSKIYILNWTELNCNLIIISRGVAYHYSTFIWEKGLLSIEANELKNKVRETRQENQNIKI